MPNINCKCDSNFTCGYCLGPARKPYFFTCSDGTRIYEVPVQSNREADRAARDRADLAFAQMGVAQ